MSTNRIIPVVLAGIVFLFVSQAVFAHGQAEKATTAAASNAPFQGTINMFADQYGPTAQHKTTEMMTLATKYEASHPGVKINFIQVPTASGYNAWVRTKAAGGQLPDILYEEWTDVNSAMPSGTFTNLNPYLSSPDPYVSGKTWEQVLNPRIVAQTAASNGDTYLIHGDYVGQGMFYNKTIFAKAGITTLPVTWTQFIADSQKIKAAGYIPVFVDMSTNGEGEFTWFSRLIYTNFYHNQFNTLRYTGTPAINSEDQVIAIKKGILGPQSPRWMEFWKLMKQFTNYLEPNATGVTGTGDIAYRAFLNGKSAMLFGGSWTPNQLKGDHATISYGSFPDPYPTKANIPYATDFNSSAAVGGPNAQFQYGIATHQSDNSMTPAKLKASVNWLEYISTPANDSSIVNAMGIFAPTVVGSTPAPALKNLANLSSLPLESNFGGIDLNSQELDTVFRAFQGYVLNQMSLAQFGKTAGAAMTKTADQLISKNHWNLSKYGVS